MGKKWADESCRESVTRCHTPVCQWKSVTVETGIRNQLPVCQTLAPWAVRQDYSDVRLKYFAIYYKT